MYKVISWEKINQDLGSEVSTFQDWLQEQEDITIFVTGIFEKDLEEFRNEKRRNVENTA